MNPSSNQPQQVPGATPQPGMPYVPPANPAGPAGSINSAPQMAAQPVPPQYQQQYQQAPPQAPQPQQYSAPVSSQPQIQSAPLTTPGTKPMPHANPNSTQNMLQIAEIRDGVVIMNDGSFRSVVMVKSINFDLMSPQEQEAIEYSFQGFLNSLYFPIQIFVRSQKVDLGPYIDKLDKIRAEHDNMLLALLMEDYIGYMSSLAEQTNIMDKKFYVVIPYFPHQAPQKSITQSKNFVTGFVALFNNKESHVVINEQDLEKAKSELRQRVQAVLAGLGQSNIQALPLDTQELIELYYDTYNPDTATRQQLKNFNDLTADYVTKGEGRAAQPHLDKELT